jgi:hypothetical protein
VAHLKSDVILSAAKDLSRQPDHNSFRHLTPVYGRSTAAPQARKAESSPNLLFPF